MPAPPPASPTLPTSRLYSTGRSSLSTAFTPNTAVDLGSRAIIVQWSAVKSWHVQKATEFAASAYGARTWSLDIAGNAEFDEAERRVADTLDAMAGMDLP